MATTDNPIVALDGLGELQGDLCPNSHEIVRFLDVRSFESRPTSSS